MQLWRNTAFLTYGSSKFLQNGYLNSGIKPSDLDHFDLTGKSYLITGANSGIGFATTQYLASHGGTVHMVCRSQDLALEASRKIMNETSNSNIFVHICDLKERINIEQLVHKIKNQNIHIDVVINNAGIMNHSKELNSDGVEVTFSTNLLSNFLLTNLLIPILQYSNDPRVIFVSSAGGLTQPLTVDPIFSTLNPWDGRTAYAITKRQQIALCEKFASFYSNTKIKFFSMHPGWVDTPQISLAMPEFYQFYKNSLRTPQQGADTICWLCVTDKLDLSHSGEFFRDHQPEYKHLPLSMTSYSQIEIDNLWNTCCNLTGWQPSKTSND